VCLIVIAKFNASRKFNFDLSGWAKWFARWSRYRTLLKLNQEEQLQFDSFLYCIGNKIESTFNGLALSDEEAKNYQNVSEAF